MQSQIQYARLGADLYVCEQGFCFGCAKKKE